jgi:hypothetical protein
MPATRKTSGKVITFIAVDHAMQSHRIEWVTTDWKIEHAWAAAEDYFHHKMGWGTPDAFNRRLSVLYVFKGKLEELSLDSMLRQPTAEWNKEMEDSK